jgi:hypothetical protein
MIPNNIQIGEDGVKFRLSWVGPINALGYLVCCARDSEFTVERRCFFIPCIGADGVSLDMGGGTWFFRIGTLAGNLNYRGRVVWSNIYGPCSNAGARPPPPHGSNIISLLHNRPIVSGIRVNVSYDRAAYIVIFECSRSADLRASDTQWTFHIDTVRRGSVDCLHMEHPHRYYVRCFGMDGAEFPTDRIVPLGVGLQFQGVPEKPIKHFDTAIQSLHRADQAILRRNENERNITFLSHADYVRYQAARARSGVDSVRRV